MRPIGVDVESREASDMKAGGHVDRDSRPV
jgi:hypothetical protein